MKKLAFINLTNLCTCVLADMNMQIKLKRSNFKPINDIKSAKLHGTVFLPKLSQQYNFQYQKNIFFHFLTALNEFSMCNAVY